MKPEDDSAPAPDPFKEPAPDPFAEALRGALRVAMDKVEERLAIDVQRRQRVVPLIRSIQSELAALFVKLGLMVPPVDSRGRAAFFALCDASGLGGTQELEAKFNKCRRDMAREVGLPSNVGAIAPAFRNAAETDAARLATDFGMSIDDARRFLKDSTERLLDSVEPTLEAFDLSLSFGAALSVCEEIKEKLGLSERDLRPSVARDIAALSPSLSKLGKALAAIESRGVPSSALGGRRQTIEDARRSELIRALVERGFDCNSIAAVLEGLGISLPGDEPLSPESVAEYRDKVLLRTVQRRRSKTSAKPKRQPRKV